MSILINAFSSASTNVGGVATNSELGCSMLRCLRISSFRPPLLAQTRSIGRRQCTLHFTSERSRLDKHKLAGAICSSVFSTQFPTSASVCRFGHLAGSTESKDQKAPNATALKNAKKTSADLGSETDISQEEQRRKDWAIIKRLLINIWPPGDWNAKSRVILGFGFLIAGKVCCLVCGHGMF